MWIPRSNRLFKTVYLFLIISPKSRSHGTLLWADSLCPDRLTCFLEGPHLCQEDNCQNDFCNRCVLKISAENWYRYKPLHRQVNLLEVVADDVLPEAAWLTSVCICRVEIVDDSGRVVIKSSQDDCKPMNDGSRTVFCWPFTPAELLTGHIIGPVYRQDSFESAQSEAVDAGDGSLAVRFYLSAL